MILPTVTSKPDLSSSNRGQRPRTLLRPARRTYVRVAQSLYETSKADILPYYGQWFRFRHPEKNLTSVIDRYANEIKRVFGVIDGHLAKTGKPYLVGDKCTFADLMFVPWNRISPMLLGEGSAEELEKSVPLAWEWRQRMEERESVKKTYAEM